MFAHLPQALADMLRRLPSQCAVCRAWDSQRLCADCISRYATVRSRCERCAIEVPSAVTTCGACLKQAPPYDNTLTAVDYDYPWDGLITRLKFNAELDLAALLAQRLIDAYRRSPPLRPDWLLPVPLSAHRLHERGFNQAWQIARLVAPAVHCTARSSWLLRVKDTAHQLSLPLEKRCANVRGAFAVSARGLHSLRGRSVAVLDDVMTSGATATEIALTLREAGVASVQVWVVARTPRAFDL